MFAVELVGVGGLASSTNALGPPTKRYIMVLEASENDSRNCSALCTLNLLVAIAGMFYLLVEPILAILSFMVKNPLIKVSLIYTKISL
jgi:hypothetical protein